MGVHIHINQGGGGTPAELAVSTTYTELKALRDGANLVPGTWYRITDYVCTTTQKGTRSAHNAFDVIVRADDESHLNENAFASLNAGDNYFKDCKLEAWQLKYCLENDTGRFGWADDENGRGVIYYMRDEWGNECPYDFKNILFDRAPLDSVLYPGILGTFSACGFPGIELSDDEASLYTFCLCAGTNSQDVTVIQSGGKTDLLTHDNIVMPSYQTGKGASMVLPGNVCVAKGDSILGCQFFKGNKFGVNCLGNTLGDGCSDNNFQNNCSFNTLSDASCGNTLGEGCNHIIFEDCKRITVSSNVQYAYVTDSYGGRTILSGSNGDDSNLLLIDFENLGTPAELFAGVDNKGELQIWNPANT